MVEIPESVRLQALHPFRELPTPPGFQKLERDAFLRLPSPTADGSADRAAGARREDVEAAVEEARALVRGHGRTLLIWLLGPGDESLGVRLEQLGLVHADSPGFESIENAMALVEPPAGSVASDVTVEEVDSFESFCAAQRLSSAVFEFTAEMREQLEEGLAARYAEFTTPGSPMRQFNAIVEGRVVGTAAAAVGGAGVNLFGGSVLPDARGRGVYRALTQARWELAVALGTPALTIQAGRMSRPIAERLGFVFIAALRVYVDDFSDAERGSARTRDLRHKCRSAGFRDAEGDTLMAVEGANGQGLLGVEMWTSISSSGRRSSISLS